MKLAAPLFCTWRLKSQLKEVLLSVRPRIYSDSLFERFPVVSFIQLQGGVYQTGHTGQIGIHCAKNLISSPITSSVKTKILHSLDHCVHAKWININKTALSIIWSLKVMFSREPSQYGTFKTNSNTDIWLFNWSNILADILAKQTDLPPSSAWTNWLFMEGLECQNTWMKYIIH